MGIQYFIAALAIALPAAAFGQTPDAPRQGPPYASPPFYDTAGVVPLRDFLLRLLDEKDRRDQQRFEAQEKALAVLLDNNKTTIAADLALKIQEQGQKYVEKQAAKDQFDALDAKVDVLTMRLDDMRAASAATANVWAIVVGTLIGVGGIAVGFVQARKGKR